MEPRKVIGSIDTSEFIVAVAASIGFLVGLGAQSIDFSWVAVLLLGGMLAAPLAAWLVRRVPGRVLGSAVGGMIVLTNVRTILRSDSVDASDARVSSPMSSSCWCGPPPWRTRSASIWPNAATSASTQSPSRTRPPVAR